MDYVWLNVSPRSAEGYESIVYRHVIPDMGNLLLTQLKAERIQRYYSDKLVGGRFDGKGGLSSNSVIHHHSCIHQALEMALTWGMISRNPADAVTPPPPLLLKQNVHPKVVQERLGHATVSTTRDLYSHVSPGLQEAAARRFDEILSPKYNEKAGSNKQGNEVTAKVH